MNDRRRWRGRMNGAAEAHERPAVVVAAHERPERGGGAWTTGGGAGGA